jgi:type II secretory pathway component HofQ
VGKTTVPHVKTLIFLAIALFSGGALPADDKLSLDLQKIPLVEALNVYADFTGLNIIADSGLDESVSVDLKQVKSSTFLELLVELYDLHVVERDGVLVVMKRAAYEARHPSKQVRVIPVLYSSAADLVQSLNNKTQSQAVQGQGAIQSPAMSNYIGVDKRTNSIVLEGAIDFVERNQAIIQSLDKRSKLLNISARLVSIASDDLKNLGRKLDLSLQAKNEGHSQVASLFNDLGVISTSGYSLAIGKVGSYLIDMEFQALKEKGKIDIVSKPSLITLNNSKALISQGLQIPFQIQDPNGSFHTEFKDAALTLEVVPRHIDGLIILEVFLSKDNPGATVAAGTTIEKRQIKTVVQVKPGETVILGGIRENINSDTRRAVPFFDGIPILDYLFSSKETENNSKELVIFLTPSLIS